LHLQTAYLLHYTTHEFRKVAVLPTTLSVIYNTHGIQPMVTDN